MMIAFLLGFLAAAAGASAYVWIEIDEVEMSGHGITALNFGVAVILAIGAGLMRLVYISHRRG